MSRLLAALIDVRCEDAGHQWRFIGGCNAGCDRSCECSVPVHECRRCGDCDYGDNAEGRNIRHQCSADRIELMTDAERRRWLAGRGDWREDEWQDHCGDPDCENCVGEIPRGEYDRSAQDPSHDH